MADLNQYLQDARDDLARFFPGLTVIIAGAEKDNVGEVIKRLPRPGVVLRTGRITDSEFQDHALVEIELYLFWKGENGANVAHQLRSWAYRRFRWHRSPEMETGEYDASTGAIDYVITWGTLVENDYSFNPLEVDGFVIREVQIHTEEGANSLGTQIIPRRRGGG